MHARRWVIAVGAAAGFALTGWLGLWQWGRAQQKEAQQATVTALAALPPLDERQLFAAPDPAALLHRQVVLQGTWDAAHTVFLDNRQMGGSRQGFFVVTPLRVAVPGRPDAAILVQRGWAPRDFTDRAKLPAIETPAGVVTVRGRLAPPPAKLYELGEPTPGPIRQNLDTAAFAAETRLALPALAVQQAGAASEGLLREWPEPASGAATNWGYAFQWWALAVLIAVLYAWFQLIAPRRNRRA